ncbi:MAG: hypothetical protein HYS16_00255 [Deltaproteobacteria bacterium]|nr:MAG: hypothetical protein HYS16_00255 [Deltaproteobacteria bacterium]
MLDLLRQHSKSWIILLLFSLIILTLLTNWKPSQNNNILNLKKNYSYTNKLVASPNFYSIFNQAIKVNMSNKSKKHSLLKIKESLLTSQKNNKKILRLLKKYKTDTIPINKLLQFIQLNIIKSQYPLKTITKEMVPLFTLIKQDYVVLNFLNLLDKLTLMHSREPLSKIIFLKKYLNWTPNK